MTDCVAQYKKSLKKSLHCSHSIKQRLLNKFNLSLSPFLEEIPNPTTDELYTSFGLPSDMAQILMAEVTPEENAQYRKRKITIRIIAGVLAGILAVAFLSVTAYIYLWKEQPIGYYNEVIVEDDETPGDGIIIEEGE